MTTADDHTPTQTIQRLNDPYFGKVWVRVGCDWCGAKGRYQSEAIAQAHADKHNQEATR